MSSIWMAWKGVEGDEGLWWASTSESIPGTNWDQHDRGDLNSSCGPALAVFNGRLFMAWRGVEAELNQPLYLASTPDGSNWEAPRLFSESSQGPALAVFKERLFIAWKAPKTEGLWLASGDNGIQVDGKQVGPNYLSSQGPALVAFNGRLLMAWKGADGDEGLWWASSDDGINFDGPNQFDTNYLSSQGPALAVYNDRLFMAWKGADGDLDPQRLHWVSTPDLKDWSIMQSKPSFNSSQRPALAVFPF